MQNPLLKIAFYGLPKGIAKKRKSKTNYCFACQKSFGNMAALNLDHKCLCGAALVKIDKCRKCSMPKKANYGSSNPLDRFEIDKLDANGTSVHHSDTRASKIMFEFERSETVCQCEAPIYNEDFHRLMIRCLGENPSKNAIKKWKRNPNYKPTGV